MAAAMDRNPQITINNVNPNIEALLQRIDTAGTIEAARAALHSKLDILNTIDAFKSIDTQTGHPIYRVDGRGNNVPGSEESLAQFVQTKLSSTRIEDVQIADQFICSMALSQRVRDITTETNLVGVRDYLVAQRDTLSKHQGADVLVGAINKLVHDITAIRSTIEQQSNASSNLFATESGMSSERLKANQAKGAAMVPGIKELIDGDNGLRVQCMNALTFVIRELPKAVEKINKTLVAAADVEVDEDEGAEDGAPHRQIKIEAFNTVGMHPDLLALLTPAQRVTKLAELTAQRDGISKAIEDLELNLQQLIDALEQTYATLATTRSTKDTVLTQMDLAGFQNTVKGTPTKSKAKFKTSHDESQLEIQKAALESQETALAETCDDLKQRIKTLVGLRGTAEADLGAVQQQIDALNSAFDDALAAYHTAQQDYSKIAADLNAEDAKVKAILEESGARKAALPEKLEGAKATAKAMHDAAKATFIKGQAENIDAKLKELAVKINSNWVEGSAQFAHDSKEHQDLMTKIVTLINPPLMVEAQQLSAQRTHDRAEAFAQIEAEYGASIKGLDEENEGANQALDGQIARLHETQGTILANLEAFKTPVNLAYEALEKIAAIAGKDIGEVEYIVDFVAAKPAAAAAAESSDDGSSTEEEADASEDSSGSDTDGEDAPAPADATPLTPAQIALAAARLDYEQKVVIATASRDAAEKAPDDAALKAQYDLDNANASEAGTLVAPLEAALVLSDAFTHNYGASAAAPEEEEAHVVNLAGNSDTLGDDF